MAELSTGLSWEAVGVLVAAMAVFGVPALGFAMQISSRLATIVNRLDTVEAAINGNRADHQEFYRRLNGHEVTLVEHEQRLKVFEN
jgi:hypothetical protein